VLAIGVAAYMLSQPREGTVEWHKKRFERKAEQSLGGTLLLRVLKPRGLARLRRMPNHVESAAQLDPDYEALLRLGFLVKNTYRLTNKPVNLDGRWIMQVYSALPEERACFSSFGSSADSIFVIAPAQDIPIWEQFIAREDASPQ
jgi:hypothetical protein